MRINREYNREEGAQCRSEGSNYQMRAHLNPFQLLVDKETDGERSADHPYLSIRLIKRSFHLPTATRIQSRTEFNEFADLIEEI